MCQSVTEQYLRRFIIINIATLWFDLTLAFLESCWHLNDAALGGIYFNQKLFRTHTTSSANATINGIHVIFLHIHAHTHSHARTRFLFSSFYRVIWRMEFICNEFQPLVLSMMMMIKWTYIHHAPTKSIDTDSIIYDRKSWIERFFFIVVFTSSRYTHKMKQMSWPKITHTYREKTKMRMKEIKNYAHSHTHTPKWEWNER